MAQRKTRQLGFPREHLPFLNVCSCFASYSSSVRTVRNIDREIQNAMELYHISVHIQNWSVSKHFQ